jgi:multiple sugar transport system substrate-binding protein
MAAKQRGEKTAVIHKNALAAPRFFLKLKGYAPEGVEMYNSSEVRDALQQGDSAIAIRVWPAWVPSLDDPNVSIALRKIEIQATPGLIAGPSPMLGASLPILVAPAFLQRYLVRGFAMSLT